MIVSSVLKAAFYFLLIAVGFRTVQSTADQMDLSSLVVTKGDSATLPCYSASGTRVIWTFNNPWKGRTSHVYSNGMILNGFNGRFTVEALDGQQYLHINATKCNDAGLYECTEEDGIGASHLILLNVIGTECQLNENEVAGLTTGSSMFDSTGNISSTDCTTRAQCLSSSGNAWIVGFVISTVAWVITLIVLILFVRKRRRRSYSGQHDQEAGQALVSRTSHHSSGSDISTQTMTESSVLFDGAMDKLGAETLAVITNKAIFSWFMTLKNKEERPEARGLKAVWSVCKTWSDVTRKGQLQSSLRASLKKVDKNYRQTPRYLGSVNDSDHDDVCGFCKLNNFIYIVCNRAIYEYAIISHKKFERTNTFTADFDMGCVFAGLTANKSDDHIYLGDSAQRCIWKISTKSVDSRSQFFKWYMLPKSENNAESRENVHSLCVKPNGSIVALTGIDYRSDKYWRGRIHVIQSDGCLETVINLADEIIRPSGITCTTNTFIVTHKAVGANVVEVNLDGDIVRTCHALRDPRRCHCDYKANTIFALEMHSHRVMLFNKSFRLLQVLLEFHPKSETDFYNWPNKILYSTTSKLLFVQMLSGKVRAYRF